MKKTYMKPGMYVENFNLSQSVAAGGCGASQHPEFGTPTQSDRTSCGWNNGVKIAWTAAPACNLIIGADDEFSGVCYNNPNGGASIFSLS